MNYLTPADIARELGVSVRSAYEYIRTMRHLRIGKHLRVSRASFESWKQCRENSGDEMEAVRGGRISTGAESRRGARIYKPLARGSGSENEKAQPRVTMPRAKRRGATP